MLNTLLGLILREFDFTHESPAVQPEFTDIGCFPLCQNFWKFRSKR